MYNINKKFYYKFILVEKLTPWLQIKFLKFSNPLKDLKENLIYPLFLYFQNLNLVVRHFPKDIGLKPNSDKYFFKRKNQ